MQGKRKPRNIARKIEFDQYYHRRIALKFLYLGWDYCGLALQGHVENTVMEKILCSMETTMIIESREAANLSLCGRTDKGVSALSQVISVNVRSHLTTGVDFIPESGPNVHQRTKLTLEEEIDYITILNGHLPSDIKIYGWAGVDPDFSARFSCQARTYKYFFPIGGLDIELIKQASEKLVGEKDFRHFCKYNNDQKNTMRRIHSIDFETLSENKSSGFTMYVATIRGSAFLYHMIRKIMSVLLLVGNKQEKPSVVDGLLDVTADPKIPVYEMAEEWPLVLWDTEFPGVEWTLNPSTAEHFYKTMYRNWTMYNVRATMLTAMMQHLPEMGVLPGATEHTQPASICRELHRSRYTSILDRPRQGTFEEMHARRDAKKRSRELLEQGDEDEVEEENSEESAEKCQKITKE